MWCLLYYLWSLRYCFWYSLDSLGSLVSLHFLTHQAVYVIPEILIVGWDIFDGAFRCPMSLLSTVVAIATLFSFCYGGTVLFWFSILEVGWYLMGFLVGSILIPFLIVAPSFGIVHSYWFPLFLVREIGSIMPRVIADKAGSLFLRFGSSSSSFLFSFLLHLFD